MRKGKDPDPGPLTNVSGSGRPKNLRIRIRNTGFNGNEQSLFWRRARRCGTEPQTWTCWWCWPPPSPTCTAWAWSSPAWSWWRTPRPWPSSTRPPCFSSSYRWAAGSSTLPRARPQAIRMDRPLHCLFFNSSHFWIFLGKTSGNQSGLAFLHCFFLFFSFVGFVLQWKFKFGITHHLSLVLTLS